MARMGERLDEKKHQEIKLDGIGGVSIVVKADVHRSGMWHTHLPERSTDKIQELTSQHMHLKTKPRLKVSPRWQREPVMRSLASRTMLSGTLTRRRREATHRRPPSYADFNADHVSERTHQEENSMK